MEWFSRILLSPIAMLYGLAVSTRNALYESNMLKSTSFDLPVVSIGNVKVGGTGKTPMVEWLIHALGPYLNTAVLSRGFSRKTKGYRLVSGKETSYEVGDEALQLKRKFPSVAVGVCESRTIGLSSLLMDSPQTQVVFLDDAFQHRSIRPSLSIVLTEYFNPYFKDFLMPVGKLREWRSAVSRGDYLIVSKCPEGLTSQEAEAFKEKVVHIKKENIFFAKIRYGVCYAMTSYHKRWAPAPDSAVQILSGIAEPDYLKEYYRPQVDKVFAYDFPDHHPYDESDVNNIIKSFSRIPHANKALITTEKDIVKLINYKHLFEQANIELYIQQISIQILFDQHQQLASRIKEFLLNFAR